MTAAKTATATIKPSCAESFMLAPLGKSAYKSYMPVETSCAACGAKLKLPPSWVRQGRNNFCSRSCSSKTNSLRHGMTGTRTYRIWAGMLQRCRNPKDPKYPDYGGRGISVCEEWSSFDAFFAAMGTCPPDHSIDRIDNDGPYEPANCRWATRLEQQSNQRTNRRVSYKGKVYNFAQLARELNLPVWKIRSRVLAGWPEQHWNAPPTTGGRRPR
jgi:hypothetical protein